MALGGRRGVVRGGPSGGDSDSRVEGGSPVPGPPYGVVFARTASPHRGRALRALPRGLRKAVRATVTNLTPPLRLRVGYRIGSASA